METRIAVTNEEKEAVFRSRCGPSATGDLVRGARLVDPEDENSWLIYGVGTDGEVVGSYRVTRGSDGFSLRQIDRFGLEPFLAELAPRLLAVIERLVVPSTEPNGGLAASLLHGARELPGWEGVLVVFGACSRRLTGGLPFGRIYQAPAARAARRTDLVHLVAFPRGVHALSGMGAGPGIPACVAAAVRTPVGVEPNSPSLG